MVRQVLHLYPGLLLAYLYATVFDTNSSTLSSELILFLSKDAIVERVGKSEIPENEQQELYDSFFWELIQCEALSNSAYRIICRLIPNVYDVDAIELTSISRSKLAALCDTATLIFSSQSLSAVFDIDRALSMSFLEKNIDTIESSNGEFPISIRLVEHMVVSSSLSVLQKVMVINCVEPTELLAHTGSLDWLITFITDHQVITV